MVVKLCRVAKEDKRKTKFQFLGIGSVSGIERR